jgi:hypothetical protein
VVAEGVLDLLKNNKRANLSSISILLKNNKFVAGTPSEIARRREQCER